MRTDSKYGKWKLGFDHKKQINYSPKFHIVHLLSTNYLGHLAQMLIFLQIWVYFFNLLLTNPISFRNVFCQNFDSICIEKILKCAICNSETWFSCSCMKTGQNFKKGPKKTEGYFGRLKKETWRCFSFFLFLKLFLSETPNVIFFPERRKSWN